MDSVYNRKLFQRKEDRAARDQLRKMGGIMSSSEDLMQVAQQGFRPSQDPQMTGQGEVVSMAPSIVPSAQDMMAMQQMQPRPPQQMQRPPQQMQPPQMQTSVQAPPQMQSPQQPMQRRGFQQGGVAQMSPEQMAEYRNSRLMTGARDMSAPTMSRPTITEGAPAAATAAPVTVTEAPTASGPDRTAPSSPAEALEKAKVLIEDPNIPAEEKAKAIVQASGEPSSGDVVQDIRTLYQQSVGGEIPRDATIDELNRGIFGAVMAQSKNPRAAGAFAEGLAAALGAMRETEMGRQDREMNLKGTEFQARIGREEAAMRAAASGSNSRGPQFMTQEQFDIATEILKKTSGTSLDAAEAYRMMNDVQDGLGDLFRMEMGVRPGGYDTFVQQAVNTPRSTQGAGVGTTPRTGDAADQTTRSGQSTPVNQETLLSATNRVIQQINAMEDPAKRAAAYERLMGHQDLRDLPRDNILPLRQ